MTTADMLWKLIAAGLLPDAAVPRACVVLEVSKADLRAARARYECPEVSTAPRTTIKDGYAATVKVPLVYEGMRPITNEPVSGYLPDEPPSSLRAQRSARTFTHAGRTRAADRIFATFRAEQFRCDVCGDIVRPDELVKVDHAHHVTCKGAA